MTARCSRLRVLSSDSLRRRRAREQWRGRGRRRRRGRAREQRRGGRSLCHRETGACRGLALAPSLHDVAPTTATSDPGGVGASRMATSASRCTVDGGGGCGGVGAQAARVGAVCERLHGCRHLLLRRVLPTPVCVHPTVRVFERCLAKQQCAPPPHFLHRNTTAPAPARRGDGVPNRWRPRTRVKLARTRARRVTRAARTLRAPPSTWRTSRQR